jgi:SAM-dependent methyltransferase
MLQPARRRPLQRRMRRLRRRARMCAGSRAGYAGGQRNRRNGKAAMITLAQLSSTHGEVAILHHQATGRVLYRQGEWYQSEADARGVSLAPYIHAIYGLLLQGGSRDVLMIGCGGGTLATMLRQAGVEVAIVDVAAHSFSLARRYFQLPADVACHVADGHDFLRAHAALYDAIVLDAYEGDRIPAHFLTESFLQLVKARLRQPGCMLANIHVLHDFDPAPDRFACLVESVWRDVRLLDARGTVNRNAIVMAGEVAGLAAPALMAPPDAGGEEIAHELARLAFRPWQRASR